MTDEPAVQLRFTSGVVQIHVNNQLRLEAPWSGPAASVETSEILEVIS
jgi:hypothetical protein